MDFELSDDQIALRDAVRSLCQSRFSSEVLHEISQSASASQFSSARTLAGDVSAGEFSSARTPVGESAPATKFPSDHTAAIRAAWQELAAMGVFNLLSEDGFGWVEAVVVFEELGRSLVPGPLIATCLAAPLISEAAEGKTIVTATSRSDSPTIIEHPDLADVLLVLEEDSIGTLQMSALADTAIRQTPLDPLTPVARLAELPQSELLDGGANMSSSWQLQAALLAAAQQLGISEAALDSAVQYAKERKQFNKPIGQFQAVKHMCADMLTAVEVARAGVYYAGALLGNTDAPEDIINDSRAISVARVMASEAGTLCGRNCVQIHGGMGYTWEMDAHLFLKRAWVLDTAFGSPYERAERIAETISQ